MRTLYSLLLAFALATASPAQTPQLQNAFPNLSFDDPTDIQAPDDGSNRLFVTAREGRIRVVENDSAATEAPVFLDITDRVF